MPNDQEPVLNKQAALELCNDDEDLFLEIVQAYLENMMEISKYLLYALEAGDDHKVEERLNVFKGSSSNYYVGTVREVVQLLERAGLIEDLSKVPQLYKVFKKEFRRLLDHLNTLPPPSA